MGVVMDYWAEPPMPRDQLVLFPTQLDEAVPADHPVRILDEILRQLNWSKWEAPYHLERGRPPIHPRVVAGVLLYGLLRRVRSSRALEEALSMRVDFRWLTEGFTIDHSKLCKFRVQHKDALRDLFVQVGLVARFWGFLPLAQLAFDGTRVRANNRRSGTRTPEELQASREELQKTFSDREQRMTDGDATEVGSASGAESSQELADAQRRRDQIEAALKELDRAKEAEEATPPRIPVTDPQSRVMPNKEGGFAPNYTPVATVDTKHGFIVNDDVVSLTNEDPLLIPQIDEVQAAFGLKSAPPEVLMDGLNCTGANLQKLEERNITAYGPSKLVDPTASPAWRADLTQPVPQEIWDQLPMQKTTLKKGETISQLSKDAFLFDAEHNCYWCPNGRPLTFSSTTTEKIKGGTQARHRFKSNPADCAGCPLRAKCLKPGGKQREVSRFEHDGRQEKLARRMSTSEGKAKYARRCQAAERPFAMIKSHFGVRQFLLRGLDKVRQEWRWATTAFNLRLLITLWPSRQRPGPAAALSAAAPGIT